MTSAVAPAPASMGLHHLPSDERRSSAERRLAIWIGGWTLVGIALRLTGARGGLWLDEAYSASLAHEAGTVARVFVAINHDNNHHLNTLWMLAVGWGAPPLVVRALSILTGSLTIVVAGAFAGRRSITAGAIAAALFAVSPLIATYGMEARGYAPMLLATLGTLYLIDGWLADPSRPPPARTLGAIAAFGVLSHLTFVYALAAIGGWAAWELTRASARRPWQAARRWLALMGHALLVVAAMLALVWLAGRLSPGGFRFGSYRPFSAADFAQGTGDMLTFALGDVWPATTAVLPTLTVAGVIAALALVPELGRRRSLYLIAILALPAAMAAARLGNANCARYYLISGAVLMLLVAEALTASIAAGGRTRTVALAAIGFIALGAGSIDATTIRSRRGDPARAIAALRERAPAGATILADPARETPVLAVNAASAGYPLDVVANYCRPARFLFVDAEQLPIPADASRCGRRYRVIAAGYAHGLSGLHWQLYEAL